LIDIENKRLELQRSLDDLRTQSERNKLGQFATPSQLANSILREAYAILRRRKCVSFLDPAFGTGSFYSALLNVFPSDKLSIATAFEIDADFAEAARRLWNDFNIQIQEKDFTSTHPPKDETQKADLIICNPPYVRHHHLTAEQKQRLRLTSRAITGLSLSGLAGLYCHFLLISHGWLARRGLGVWLVPSEFMDVNYGSVIRKYLLEKVTLLRIHRFDPDEVQFNDALVSSAVVFLRNQIPSKGQDVTLTFGGSLAKPRLKAEFSRNALRMEHKWTKLPQNGATVRGRGYMPLAQLFDIKRGLATGANGFFILSESQAKELELPTEMLKPILPSPRYLTVDEVQGDEKGKPTNIPRLVLLSCDMQEDDVRATYPSLWNYLQKGRQADVPSRYLCRHRSPWYSQERRPPAPILCTYMGRSKSTGKRPFRFVLNNSQATASNVYLLLYPKKPLLQLLAEDPAALRSIWKQLNTVPAEQLLSNGREYGGGLCKMEPRELANIDVSGLIDAIDTIIPEPPQTRLRL